MYPASVKYLNRQWIIQKLRQWTLGATIDLGFAICDWLVSDFYVYLSLVFRACYHWWICLLVWLLSSLFFLMAFKMFSILIIHFLIFYFNNFIFFFLLSFFLSFLSFFFFSPFSSEPCGWQCTDDLALSLWGERAEFRTLDRQRPPGPCNINWWELSVRSLSQC